MRQTIEPEGMQSALTGLEGHEPGVIPLRRPGIGVRDLARWAGFHCRSIARWGGMRKGDDLFVFAQAAKLTEEVGELNAELLARRHLQRKDKVGGQSGLGGELADVVICCAIIADALNIDLQEALLRKMTIVDQRYMAREQAADSRSSESA